jgi:hypothetical protein
MKLLCLPEPEQHFALSFLYHQSQIPGPRETKGCLDKLNFD